MPLSMNEFKTSNRKAITSNDSICKNTLADFVFFIISKMLAKNNNVPQMMGKLIVPLIANAEVKGLTIRNINKNN